MLMLLPTCIRYEARNKLALPFGQDVVSEFRVAFVVGGPARRSAASSVAPSGACTAAARTPGGAAACLVARVACLAGVHGNVPSFLRRGLRGAALRQFQVATPARAALFARLLASSTVTLCISCGLPCVLSLQTTFRNMEAVMRECVAEAVAARGMALPPLRQPLPTDRPPEGPWDCAGRRGAARRSGSAAKAAHALVRRWPLIRALAVDVAGTAALGAALAAAAGVAVAAAALAWLAAAG
jgi:hypothetical protein